MLTVGSLFSGIGGIDLGLERAGMSTRWFVEVDHHCRNVLARHWPNVPIYGDIKTVDWSGVERIDVLAGGFPCQPISNAGKRLGTSDERWLWPEFARAIRHLRPRFVLVENVAALLGRGFGEVVSDLATLGYDAEWDCIPAAAVGAPHLRDRLWTVAHANGDGDTGRLVSRTAGSETSRGQGTSPQRQRLRSEPEPSRAPVAHSEGIGGELRQAATERQGRSASGGDVGNPDGFRGPRGLAGPQSRQEGHSGVFVDASGESLWRTGSSQWATEPAVGRVVDGLPHRVERLRSLGNAVVPQVVEWIGRRIVAVAEG